MGTDDHRVHAHLGVHAEEYDRAIRSYIPGYDEMLARIVALLRGRVPEGGLVVDLGAGTGALARAVLDGVPGARVRLVDVDPAMLEVAAARCAGHGDRVEVGIARFDDPLPACHAVVASLALHHVPERDAKAAIYGAIRRALAPGGALLLGDATVHPEGAESEVLHDAWVGHMGAHGIPEDEARALFARWAAEDFYMPLPDELEMLAEAGFPHPECFWRHGPMAVYGGFVP